MGDASESSYDLGAVVRDAAEGVPPSQHYLERVDALDNIVRECMFVSKGYAGIRSPTSQHFYASVLFTALISRGVSLAILTPHSPWATKLIEHWDYASIAGIVRTMLEIRISFYYLCVDKCSAEEWNCRWNMFNLHDCVSRQRLFQELGTEPQEAAGFAEQADELRDRLRSNAFFFALPAGDRRKILNGQTAYLHPLEDIAERAGLDRPTFRWLYLFMSTHVHGYPMSFYRMGMPGVERGRGLPSRTEEGYTAIFLSLACTFLVSTRDEVHALFAGVHRSGEGDAKAPT